MAQAREIVTPIRIEAPVLGLELGADVLTLQVPSGGCVGKEHFQVAVAESFPPQISIKMTRVSICAKPICPWART